MNWMFLDDERMPVNNIDTCDIVRSYDEAITYVRLHGIPNFISFDHDINSEPNTGYTFAKWLIEMDLDHIHTFPDDFDFFVHSANPVGKKNIECLLWNYLRISREKD